MPDYAMPSNLALSNIADISLDTGGLMSIAPSAFLAELPALVALPDVASAGSVAPPPLPDAPPLAVAPPPLPASMQPAPAPTPAPAPVAAVLPPPLPASMAPTPAVPAAPAASAALAAPVPRPALPALPSDAGTEEATPSDSAAKLPPIGDEDDAGSPAGHSSSGSSMLNVLSELNDPNMRSRLRKADATPPAGGRPTPKESSAGQTMSALQAGLQKV
ncbi:MAG: hypothetical protein EOO41_01715, partial [Methanobacteriota archaeon]